MNEKTARTILAERSGGICELCHKQRATNAHHRQNRSQQGQWTPANLLHLCGSGTTGCHGYVTGHPAAAKKWGWTVRKHAPPPWDDPLTAPVHLNGVWVLLGDDGTVHLTEGDAA